MAAVASGRIRAEKGPVRCTDANAASQAERKRSLASTDHRTKAQQHSGTVGTCRQPCDCSSAKTAFTENANSGNCRRRRARHMWTILKHVLSLGTAQEGEGSRRGYGCWAAIHYEMPNAGGRSARKHNPAAKGLRSFFEARAEYQPTTKLFLPPASPCHESSGSSSPVIC